MFMGTSKKNVALNCIGDFFKLNIALKNEVRKIEKCKECGLYEFQNKTLNKRLRTIIYDSIVVKKLCHIDDLQLNHLAHLAARCWNAFSKQPSATSSVIHDF